MKINLILNPVAVYKYKASKKTKGILFASCIGLGALTLFIPHLAYFAYRKMSHLKTDDQRMNSIQQSIFLSKPAKSHSYSEDQIQEDSLTNSTQKSDSGAKVLDDWLKNYKDDFVSHASSSNNFEKILEDGFLKPAELILREKKRVEYEAGGLGDRDIASLPEFTEDFFKNLNFLDDNSRAELKKLQAKKEAETLTQDEIEEFKLLKKEIKKAGVEEFNRLYPEGQLAFYFSLLNETAGLDERELRKKYLETIDELGKKAVDSSHYSELKSKKKLTEAEEKKLQSLLRSKQGIGIHFVSNAHFKSPPKAFSSMMLRTEPLQINRKLFRIAVDQHNNGELDKYLARKYEKWVQKGYEIKVINRVLHEARSFVIPPSKLNYDVRVLRNGIHWAYGPIAILRGDPQLIDRGNSQGDIKSAGDEHFLLAPWQNKGEFYSLPLKNQETLILGLKKCLLPFADQLIKKGIPFIYLENLTEEQKEIFTVLDLSKLEMETI